MKCSILVLNDRVKGCFGYLDLFTYKSNVIGNVSNESILPFSCIVFLKTCLHLVGSQTFTALHRLKLGGYIKGVQFSTSKKVDNDQSP